ncbi:MAG: hypothetical protein HY329_24255 [Chloroflexi bacterium]|nr:hypothetical protein [Chloroflexota bacterium]
MNGLTCWEQLGAIPAWESQDPELLAEHFLTVASYNLQHPAPFTDEALADLRTAFVDRLDHNVPVEHLRRRAAKTYAGKKRVLKKESERRPALRPWSIMIADVYLPDQPEGADASGRAWARSIRAEL